MAHFLAELTNMATRYEYLIAKNIVREYEEHQEYLKSIIPKPPLSRVLREGYGNYCNLCGSTTSKTLFGKRYCHNNKCINSKELERLAVTFFK